MSGFVASSPSSAITFLACSRRSSGRGMSPEVTLQPLDCDLAELVNRRAGMRHILAVEFGPAVEQAEENHQEPGGAPRRRYHSLTRLSAALL